VGLRELGAEVRVCAPPDEEFAALLARVGVPLVPLGPTVHSVVAGRRTGRGRETGHPLRVRVLPSSDCRRGTSLLGRGRAPIPAGGLPPVDNVRDYVFTDQPWLAADATLCPSQGMTDLDIVQTGAWILPDDRPLPQELEAFLDASAPPVYVGLGSMAAHALKDIARVAIEASRAHGRRVLLARGWPARPRWWSPRSRTRRTGPPEWPSWASARLTTARLRPSTPCPPRSERP
jgi:vancomycin aglycone glucosyltransferase